MAGKLRFRSWTAARNLVIAGAIGIAANTAAAAPAPGGAGFTVVVIGTSNAAEKQAVISALPPELMNPAANFTHDSAYQPGLQYRMILVFHQQDQFDAAPLCSRDDPGRNLPITPPKFNDMMGTTHLTGAFCAGKRTLITATSRMVGGINPGDAGFRFLVADVAKQLFPDGFDVLPRSEDSTGLSDQ